MALEKIKAGTKFVRASGSTSYGVGLSWALQSGHDLDGIVIVGDGGENTAPFFAQVYADYKKRKDKDVPVYLYQTFCDDRYASTQGGDPRNFERIMSGMPFRTGYVATGGFAPVPFTKYDLTHGQIDYYAIPNLVQSMSANSFGVIEKIMACPLVTLDQVLPLPIAVGR